MKRSLRIVATLLVTSAALAYILTQIHVIKTWHIIENASIPWRVLSAASFTELSITPWSTVCQRIVVEPSTSGLINSAAYNSSM